MKTTVKKNIAFIGFHQSLVTLLTNMISKGYPVLVTDKHISEELLLLQQTLLVKYPAANLGLSTCSKECAWESDILVMSVDLLSLQDICINIKNVITGKIMLTCQDQQYYEKLKELFPHSKVVWVNKKDIISEHAVAVEKTAALFNDSQYLI